MTTDERPFGAYPPRAIDRAVRSMTRRLPDTRLGRRLAILLRRFSLMRVGRAALDVEEYGVRLRLHPRSDRDEKTILYTPQMFEPVERAAIADAADAARAADRAFLFVDVGAGVGVHALTAARLAGGVARVLAIEPQPVLTERLAFNVAANPDLDVRPVGVAAWDRDGDVELFIDLSNRGASRIGGYGEEGEKVVVRARKLLDILLEEGFFGPDVLMIGIEGAEDVVLGPFLREAPDEALPRLILVDDRRPMWSEDLEGRFVARGYGPPRRLRQKLAYRRVATA